MSQTHERLTPAEILDKLSSFVEDSFNVEQRVTALPGKKLLESHRRANVLAHRNGGVFRYVLSTEWANHSVELSRRNIYDPFINKVLLETGNASPKLLFLGCGSGRDLKWALDEGFEAKGLDLSMAMLNVARMFLAGVFDPAVTSAIINGEEKLLDDLLVCCDVLSPEDSIVSERYSGIYAESVAGYLDLDEVAEMIALYSELLEVGGILMVGLRVTESGNLYKVEDSVGTRYFTSWSRKVLFKNNYSTLRSIAESAGLDLIDATENQHPIAGRPNFLNCFFKKKE